MEKPNVLHCNFAVFEKFVLHFLKIASKSRTAVRKHDPCVDFPLRVVFQILIRIRRMLQSLLPT